MSGGVSRIGRPVSRVVRAVRDKFPLTWLGLLLGGASLGGVFYYGRQRQDLVLYVAGLGLLFLMTLTLLLVTLVTVALRLSWKAVPRSPARVEAGTEMATGFSLPALGWLPFVSIDWQWREPEGVKLAIEARRGRLRERAICRERGEHTRTVRRVVVGDVFGLSWLAVTLEEPTPRVVLPARGRTLSAPLLEAMSGGDMRSHPMGPPDGDLVDMRRYVAGDPMKRILWKTYARTRTLMVRLPERALAPTRRTVAYLVAAEGDEPAAGVARLALESGVLGPDWRFGADGGERDVETVEEALELIVRSRAARPVGGSGLGAFLGRAAQLGAYRCVLFVSPRPGSGPGPGNSRWLEVVEAALRQQQQGGVGQMEIVIGIDGMVDDRRGRGWRRWVLRPLRDEATELAARRGEVERVAARLGAAGARVVLADRNSGRASTLAVRRRQVA